MPDSYALIDSDGLRCLLHDCVALLPNRRKFQVELTAYVTYDGRMLPALTLIRQRAREAVINVKNGVWSIPDTDMDVPLWEGNPTVARDGDLVYVPCVAPSASEILGLIRITGAPTAAFKDKNASLLNRLSDLVNNSHATFRYVRSQILAKWQHSIIDTLYEISMLEAWAYDRDTLRDKLVTAALKLSPTACIGHMVSVLDDPHASAPTMRLEYTSISPTTPPSHEPDFLGTCPPNYRFYEFPVGEGVTGACAASGAIVYRPELTGLKQRTYKEFYSGTRSELAVPIKLGGQVYGVLNLESEAARAFNDRDQQLVSIVANQAAILLTAITWQPQIQLLKRGILTFEHVVTSMHTTKALLLEILHWARSMMEPPIEYGYLATRDQYGRPIAVNNGVELSKPAIELLFPLYGQDGVHVGEMTLSSPRKISPMELWTLTNLTIPAFTSLLAAVIKASTGPNSVSRVRQQAMRLISKTRHAMVALDAILRRAEGASGGKTPFDHHTVRAEVAEFFAILHDMHHGEFESSITSDQSDQKHRTQVMTVVTRITDAMEWVFACLKIDLKVKKVGGAESATIQTPEFALMEILVELLTNVLKYSPLGHATRLQVAQPRGSDDLEIRLDDQCPAIPESQRVEVLKPGTRLKTAEKMPGSGMGLYHVNELCQRYGMLLSIETNSWGGNAFIVRARVIK